MHIHILGICGTFMGGIAALARAAGHKVTGADQNVYPPMSDQLAALGIDIVQGFGAEQVDLNPDCFVVGNVVSRGNPLMEEILNRGLPYQSGPQWLAENVLRGRRVLAVAGTHGKTTTSSLLAWLLEAAGLKPGFLIGGVPGNFSISARLGEGDCFVVEADEYDTAFFDKRAKFVHYRPDIAVLNNLEFDHADIYADIAAIRWQFHQLLRTVPGRGKVIVNAHSEQLQRVIEQGCWSSLEAFSAPAVEGDTAHWQAHADTDEQTIALSVDGETYRGDFALSGEHNLQNATAAIAAAAAVGVSVGESIKNLASFKGIKRRLEKVASNNGIDVYDDFAHHPTAVRMTLEGLRRDERDRRIVVAFEPRSNTMKMGVHEATLANAFVQADKVFVLAEPDAPWDVEATFASLGERASVVTSAEDLFANLRAELQKDDRVILMSNGGFAGVRERVVQHVNGVAELG